MIDLIMRRFFHLCGFLIFLGLLFTETGYADIVTGFESPAANQHVSGVSAISGWAFSSNPQARLTVQFRIDGGASSAILCCRERADVAQHYPSTPQALKSGFALLFNFNLLPAGSHTIAVEVQDDAGSPHQIQEHTIEVAKPGGFEFLNSLTLSSASKTDLSSDKQEIIIQGAQAEDKDTGKQQEVNLHLAWQENAQRIGVVAAENVGNPSGGSSSGGTGSDCTTTDTCPTPPAIQMVLENPSGGATGIATETLSGIGVVSGWTFSSTSGATISSIRLRVDGESAGDIPCCSDRPDVKAAFPNQPQALRSGFGALLNFNLFASGIHIISVEVEDNTGVTKHIERSIETVKVADSEFLDQFDLSAAKASIEGETLLLDGVKVRDKASQQMTQVTTNYAWEQDCQCFIAQAGCGNGALEGGEECDGSNLGGESCTTLGFSGGSLSCRPRCASGDNNCVLPCILNLQDCQGGPLVYVTNVSSDTVSVIKLATDYETTNEIVATVKVGNEPRGIAISPDGSVAYVANFQDGTLSVLKTATNTVIDTIAVGAGPLGVTFAPDGTKAYVVNGFDDSVSVVDTATRKVATSIPVGSQPQAIALATDGKQAYVTNYGGNSVTVLDLGTNQPITTVLVGKGPDGIAVSPDDKKVYVVNFDGGSVSVLDRASNKVTTIPVELQPTKVTFSPNGLEAYVSNSVSETISVIDTSQLKVVNSIVVVSSSSVATHPDGIVVTPGGTRLYVALFGNGFGSEVEVISLITKNILEIIRVGDGPFALAISPTSGLP
jgi:YVTN family beta-propeller protein